MLCEGGWLDLSNGLSLPYPAKDRSLEGQVVRTARLSGPMSNAVANIEFETGATAVL